MTLTTKKPKWQTLMYSTTLRSLLIYASNSLTCFPEQVTLLMIWIEGLSKSVWLEKTVSQKKEVFGAQVTVHSLLFPLLLWQASFYVQHVCLCRSKCSIKF